MGNEQSNANLLMLCPLLNDFLYEDIGDEPFYEQNSRYLGNRHRDRGYALTEVTYLSNTTYASMFRIGREGFENLLELISPFMHDTDEDKATASSGSSITKRTKLYATLRWLAGGSFHYICFAWGISLSAFYSDDIRRGIYDLEHINI